MITFTIGELEVESHLLDLAYEWARYGSRRPLLKPVGLNTYGANTHAFKVDVKKLKMGFWRIKGMEATRRLFWDHRFTVMDRWCFWEALSELGKRRLIQAARDDRQPFCSHCGQRWEIDYGASPI